MARTYDEMVDLINNENVGIRTHCFEETEELFGVLQDRGFRWYCNEAPLLQVLRWNRRCLRGDLYGLALGEKNTIWAWGSPDTDAGEMEMNFCDFSDTPKFKINLSKGEKP